MRAKRIFGPLLKQGLPALITALILYALYRSIDDPQQLLHTIGAADPRFVLAGVGLVLLNNLLASAWQHQTLAHALKIPLTLGESSLIKLVSYPLRVVLLKAGDLNRAVFYQRIYGAELSLGVAATVLVPLLNLYLLMIACLIGIALSGLDPYNLRLLLLVLIVISPPLAIFGLRRVHGLAHGEGRIAALCANLSRFSGLPLRLWALLVVQTVLCLMLQVGVLNMFLCAVGVHVPLATLLWVLPMIQVISNLPITLLGIGAREWVMITLLTAFGPRESLLAAGLLSSTLDRVLLALLGLPALAPFVRRLRR
ncbi:MAG: lysylphosphatidylglycerol synthase domain-containing protein [Candidatus Alcyoniella australis]|nr:lysylphosphatidylglycerol synthase domain-containing protein [Candidatus Alcyoniella australis]